MKVRKLENISDDDVVVTLEDGNSVRLRAGGVLEDVRVRDLTDLQEFVKVERDLTEVPVREGRQYLKG